ncbi:MAG TPA: hypothetical protein VMV77_02985 [Bacteroidales bacterium]|nr:hypothetical protein [Bacteroidales bacterium]
MYNENTSENIDGDYSSGGSFYQAEPKKKKKPITAEGGIDWLISAVVGILTIIIGWVLIPQVGMLVDVAVDGILSGTDFAETAWASSPSGVDFWSTVSSFVVVMALGLFVMFFIKVLLGIGERRSGL